VIQANQQIQPPQANAMTNGQFVENLLKDLSPDGNWKVGADGYVHGSLPRPAKGLKPKFPASDQLINDLVNNKQTLSIQVIGPNFDCDTSSIGGTVRGPEGKPGQPGDAQSNLSVSPKYRFKVNGKWVPVPPRDVYAHEFGHANEFMNGTAQQPWTPDQEAAAAPTDTNPREQGAIDTERLVEGEHGDPIRPSNRGDAEFGE
jgi:hypothetical protein